MDTKITYLVTMYFDKECLMPQGEMTGRGLNHLLKFMSSLTRDGRNAFMRELQTAGFATHIPERDKKLQYSIAAVEKRS